MNTLVHADIFFFIATIGFIIIASLVTVALAYLIGILKRIRDISEKIGDDVKDISGEAKELVQEVRESGVYRMLFRRKKAKGK